MLSFRHCAETSFSDNGDGIVSQEKLNRRPTCTLQVPVNDIPTPVSIRERYMISLGVDYLCRWRVATGETAAPSPTSGALDADAETAAFYAAIEHVDTGVRHALLGVNVGDERTQPDAVCAERDQCDHDGAVQVVDAGTACHVACGMHDWSTDATQKQYFTIKSRPHVLVHFAHPCNGGREIVAARASSAAGNATAALEAVANASGVRRAVRGPTREVRDAMMEEMMRAVRHMRGRADGETVNSRVEDARAERAESFVAERRAEAKKAERVRGSTMAACTRLIERVRRLEKTTGSTSSDERDNDDSDETWDDESTTDSSRDRAHALVGAIGHCDDDSSDTFSSSGDSESNVEEPTWSDELTQRRMVRADARRNGAPKPLPKNPTYADIVAHPNPYALLSDATDSKCAPPPPPPPPPPSASGKSDARRSARDDRESRDDNDDGDESQECCASDTSARRVFVANGATTIDEEECSLPQTVRQTTVEMMVPVCEAGDSLSFFNELECPYLMQWAPDVPAAGAAGRRRKIHLFRKRVHESRGWLSTSRRNVYHLVATIEALPQ